MQKIANQIIAFMNTIEKLCRVKRFTRMSDGSNETNSDHILKVCFLAMMISPYIKKPHDPAKLLELALVHDLAEAECGDVPYFDQLNHPDVIALKKQNEQQAVEKLSHQLPFPLNNKLFDLFTEFEQAQTTEAKIIRALDVFDGNLQCNKENHGARYYNKPGTGKRVQAMIDHCYGNDTDEEIIAAVENALVEISLVNRDKCRSNKTST